MNYKSSPFQNAAASKILLFVVFFCSLFSPKFLLCQNISNVEDIYISGGAQIIIQSDKELIVLKSGNQQGKNNLHTVSKEDKKIAFQKKTQAQIKEKLNKVVERVENKPEVFFAGTSSPNSFRISHQTNDFVFNNFQNYQSGKAVVVSYAVLFSRFIKEKKIISQKVFYHTTYYSHCFYSRPPPTTFFT